MDNPLPAGAEDACYIFELNNMVRPRYARNLVFGKRETRYDVPVSYMTC